MAVVFNAVIKIAEDSRWFIELTDTTDNRVEVCFNLDEFSKKVEELGADYGGNIDEVKWSKDDNVPPHIMDEIRVEMSKQQAEIEKQKKEEI